jgi:hypothetical protein
MVACPCTSTSARPAQFCAQVCCICCMRHGVGCCNKKKRLEAQCLAIGHCTKSTLANILRTLHARGVLRNDIGEGSTCQVRSRLREALEHHSKAMTPYGRVVQRMSLPFPKDVLPTWDIAHPYALLYHMSTLSRRFGMLMGNAMAGKCEPIPIVLHIDEVVPGNPMRHDKGRTCKQSVGSCRRGRSTS